MEPTRSLAPVLVLLVAAPVALGASGPYVAGTGDLFMFCQPADMGLSEECIGGQSFDVPASASDANISVDDDVTDTTGAYYQFQNDANETLASGGFCDQTNQTVPDDSKRLDVFVDGALSVFDCDPADQPAVATTGTIHVDWS